MLVFYVHVTYYLQYVATRLPSGFRLLFLYIRTLYSGGFLRNENPAACLFYFYYDPCSTPHSPSLSASIATCYYDTRLRSTHTYTHIYIYYSCGDRFVTSRLGNSRNVSFLCARDSFTYRTNVNTITRVAPLSHKCNHLIII